MITGHSPVVDGWPVSTETGHQAEKVNSFPSWSQTRISNHLLKYRYAFQVIEKITFALIKLSIIFLWKRIFGHVRAFSIVSWWMVALVIAWSLAFFFATVFQCGIQWYLNWAPIGEFLTECTNTLNMLSVFCATDVVTDLMIIAMPAPMVRILPFRRSRD